MTTLSELRRLVRQQTETTSAELPNVTIDDYLKQAFERTVNAEYQWPFYENSWTIVQVIGQTSIPIPVDASRPGIMSLMEVVRKQRLTQLDSEEAEDRYLGTGTSTTEPVAFSIWSSNFQLWPQTTYEVDRSYWLRGFRLPTSFPILIGGAADPEQEPDADPRLHIALAHYATALAYIQQEDIELENQYMKRWQSDVEMARQIIMEPTHFRPMVMGPAVGHSTPIGHGGGRSGHFSLGGLSIAPPGPDGPIGLTGAQGDTGPPGLDAANPPLVLDGGAP